MRRWTSVHPDSAILLAAFVCATCQCKAPRLLIWTYSNFEGSRGPIGRTFSTSELSPMTLGCFRVEECLEEASMH